MREKWGLKLLYKVRDGRLELCVKQGESDSIGGLELDKGWETQLSFDQLVDYDTLSLRWTFSLTSVGRHELSIKYEF